MRKKSYASRLGVLAVALTLVTTCLVGGTMAKYTTTAAGTGTGTVAKFKVDITAAGKAVDGTIDNLFTVVGNTDNVKDNKLAPGTNGHFDLVVTNDSEVKVEVSAVTITKTDNSAAVPMKFVVTDTDVNTLPSKDFVDIADIGDQVKAKFGNNIDWKTDANANTKTARIWWQWDPTSKDEDDTNLGKDAADTTKNTPTYGLNISVKADQVIATSNTP